MFQVAQEYHLGEAVGNGLLADGSALSACRTARVRVIFRFKDELLANFNACYDDDEARNPSH